MPGAGSATVAFALESDYLSSAGSPTYYRPGKNVRFQTAEINNNLIRLFDANSPTAVDQVAQNFDGRWEATWVLKNNDFHRFIFNNDSDGSGKNDSWTNGQFPSVEWYLGLDYVDSGSAKTAERVLEGAVATRCEVTFQQNQNVEVTCAGVYGSESFNTSITSGSIADNGAPVTSHGMTLSIDSTSQVAETSVTLRMEPLATEIPSGGTSRNPTDVVAAQPEPQLDVAGTFTEKEQYELALGGGSATSSQDDIDSSSGSMTLNSDGGTTQAKYSFTGMKHDTYDWENFPPEGEDLAGETQTFNVRDVAADE